MKSVFLSVSVEAIAALLALAFVVAGPAGAQFVTTAPPTWSGGTTMSVQPGQPTMSVQYGTGGAPGVAYGAGYSAEGGVTRGVTGAGMPGYAPGATQGMAGAEMGYQGTNSLAMQDQLATRMFGEELPKDEIAKADTVLEIARVMSKNPDLTESDIPEIRTVEEYKEAAKLKVPYIKIEGKMYRYTGGLNEYQPFNDVAIIYNQYEYARIAPTVKQAISADNAQDWPDFYMMRSWQAQPNQGAQRDQSGYGQQGRAGGAQAINQTDSVMDSMGVGLDLYEQRAATGPATQGRGSPGTTGGRYPTGLQRSGYPGTAGMPGGRY